MKIWRMYCQSGGREERLELCYSKLKNLGGANFNRFYLHKGEVL